MHNKLGGTEAMHYELVYCTYDTYYVHDLRFRGAAEAMDPLRLHNSLRVVIPFSVYTVSGDSLRGTIWVRVWG